MLELLLVCWFAISVLGRPLLGNGVVFLDVICAEWQLQRWQCWF